MSDFERRAVLRTLLGAIGTAAWGIAPSATRQPDSPDIAPFRTPYKLGKLVLERSTDEGSFDSKSLDDPFVFSDGGRFYMIYTGFDGVGYQTGLAESQDLIHWVRRGLIFRRDPNDPITRYNAALLALLRDSELQSDAGLKKVGGRYLGAWNAYPRSGYEAGPAVIGLAWSHDLREWERTAPILEPEEGAEWERGGLYKPYLVHHENTYYLFYNAKNPSDPVHWREQIGVATSTDLREWTRSPHNPIVPVGPPGSWDSRFASNPAVVRHNGLWGLYYFGFDSTRARDLLAIGHDLTRFKKVEEILIDTGSPGSVDETYAHKPSVIFFKGDLYHFYCAVSGQYPHESRGISVARSRPW